MTQGKPDGEALSQGSGIRWSFAYAACCTLATIQFVWFYLSRNASGLNLYFYEQGRERTPFQYRILLAGPLRWAHDSSVLHGWASRLSELPAWFPNGVGPEGIAEGAIDFASVLLAAGAGFLLYRQASRHRLLGWLVWPLVLALSLLTHACATHHALRFAYDLPSMALFSACLVLLHGKGKLWPFYCLFALATLNRETSLLLLPFLLLGDRARGLGLRAALRRALLPLLFWTGLHFWLVHRFAGNASAAGPRFLLNLGSLLVPLSWPQIFCALGYLWPFLFLYRQSIQDNVLKSWLPGYWVWLLFMTVFGLLVEPRVFGELIPLTACLITLILEQRLLEQVLGRDLAIYASPFSGKVDSP